jgi:hypothetical protein
MPYCASGFDNKWIPRRREMENMLDAHKVKAFQISCE